MVSNRITLLNALHRVRERRASLKSREIGMSPAAIEPPRDAAPTVITWHSIGPEGYQVEAAEPQVSEGQFTWIDICGLGDDNAISELARSRGLSDLAIADLFHLDQRAHTDIDGDLVISIVRMPVSGPPFDADQITLILGSNFVLTLRESEHNCFAGVGRRLEKGLGRIRSSSAYLFYALIDAIMDSYFPILERYGDLVEGLEERILTASGDAGMRDIHLLKRDLLALRHALWPTREALAALQRDDTPHIDEALLPYLRDCSDHAFQLLDMVEVYRETAQGLVDLQLSSISNRMNEVMKVLTMIATIFIPMTFVAGLYGMNFDRASPYNLPELGWRFGYIYALGLMVTSASVMLFIFWRLGWICGRAGKDGRDPDVTWHLIMRLPSQQSHMFRSALNLRTGS